MRLGNIILALCIVAAVSAVSDAREWLELARPAAEEAVINVLSSGSDGLSFEVEVPGVLVGDPAAVPLRGVDLSIPGATTMQKPGFPDLPVLSYLVAVPATGGVEVEATVSGERVLSGFDVLPAAPFARAGEEQAEAVRDAGIYATDAVYPEAVASVGEPAVMRDLRLVQVRVFPVRYNPVGRTLVAADRIEISLRFTGGEGANPRRVDRPFRSEAFEPLYRSLVLNYDSLPRAEVRRGTYLVIARDAFATQMADFVRWKNQRGIETVLVLLSQIGTNPTADDIKAYIQSAYDTWENPPDYVLLVGDTMGSGGPSIPCFYVAGTSLQDATDHPYAELEGSDYLPDVMLGRMSVGSTTEAIVAGLKILSYERDCDAGNDSWYTKALMVAGNYGGTGVRMTSPRQTTLRVREMLLGNGYAQVDTIFFRPVTSPVPITSSINSGVSFVNYRGWGNTEGWEYPTFTRANIDALANGKMLPVMTSIVCGTGNYDRGPLPCFGETWIRSGTPSALRGGPVMTGPTEWSTHTKWNNALDVGIYKGILDEGLTHFGQALLRGKMEIYKNFPMDTSRTENVEFYFNIYNTLGDPELYLRTAAPKGFTVTHDATVALGRNRLVVSVTDSGATVPGAEVIVWKEGESYEVRALEGGRTISMPLNATTVGTAYVTVNATNYKPYTGSVTVAQQATTVGWYAQTVDDNAVAPSNGNGDGIVNPGERIELAVTLKNYGTATANAVTCALSARPPSAVQLVDGSATYGNIAAGGTAAGDAPFVFDVPSDTREGTEIVLLLTARSGASEWASEARLTVGAPALSFASAVVDDGGDGVLDPGETATLTVSLSNNGRLAATSLAGTLVGPASGLSVTDAAGSWGTIAAGGTGSNAGNTFSVSAAAGVAIGHEFTMIVNLTGAGGLSQFVTFPLVVGTPSADDPLGPDAYGYFCYDDTDAGYTERPTYSWVEIDPGYGGSGTALGLGYEDITNVSLPFTFRYYGEDFTQVGICSNGDVGMGGAPVWEHQPRNAIIPCPLGPDAMIAPFWDELFPANPDTIGHGDVFTKSLPDGRFVIEWSRLATYYDTGGNYQTFEIVLYDPAQYPTATGDGEILSQYHTIADVDPDNRATVGIEDPDQSDGVLYSFWGIRPPEAAPLANGRAIKFTTDRPDAYPSSDVPESGAQGRVVLESARPNPFNPFTVITYALPERAAVGLAVFDISGRRVATLVNGEMGPGSHEAVWDGTNDRGEDVASGVYFCRIAALGEEHSRKMVLMK